MTINFVKTSGILDLLDLVGVDTTQTDRVLTNPNGEATSGGGRFFGATQNQCLVFLFLFHAAVATNFMSHKQCLACLTFGLLLNRSECTTFSFLISSIHFTISSYTIM